MTVLLSQPGAQKGGPQGAEHLECFMAFEAEIFARHGCHGDNTASSPLASVIDWTL